MVWSSSPTTQRFAQINTPWDLALDVARFGDNALALARPVSVPSCNGNRRETTGSAEKQTCCSYGSRSSDLHSRTRLLIRRFRVRVPGGPPPKPQVGRAFQFHWQQRGRCRPRPGPVLDGSRSDLRSPNPQVRVRLRRPTTKPAGRWPCSVFRATAPIACPTRLGHVLVMARTGHCAPQMRTSPCPPVSDGDDDLSSGVPLFQIPDGFGGLAQRVRLIDDRRDLAVLDELLEHDQVLAVLLRDERAQLLAHER